MGVSGYGRQSLAKLAAFIARYEMFQIQVTRNYGLEAWRSDLKRVLKRAGADGKQVVFLVSDAQIHDDAFFEDVRYISLMNARP